MGTLLEMAWIAGCNAVLGVACYVLGNRRAERLIAYRERQAERLFPTDEPQDDGPVVYRKCLCSHSTTSHRVDKGGTRRECNTWISGKGNCACQEYIGDPGTKIKTKG